MELLTRAEMFKIIGWLISIIVPIILYRWNSKELKESEKRQEKRTDDLWKKLQKETKDRMELEKKMIEEDKEEWRTSYYQEREKREEDWNKFQERIKNLEKEITKLEGERWNLRSQLWGKGVPWEEHEISDEDQQREAILAIKGYWEAYQDKNEKINELTINEALGNWENNLKNKKGEEIIKERRRLFKKIDEEVKLSKQ